MRTDPPGAPPRSGPAPSSLADIAVERLRRALAGAADPQRAPAMAAYMRNQFPFLGIPTPEQRRVAAAAWADLPPPSEVDVVALTGRCWTLPEREFQYAACDYAIRHVRRCGDGFIEQARVLIVTKSWWDTVDALAANVVGPLVRDHPQLQLVMDEWIGSGDHWLARTAILHQLRAKDRTDTARLFGYCERRAGDTEFFIRKAIGWALREYSKTDAVAVRQFVADHHDQLSPLSQREALKWLNRKERG